MPGTLVAIGRNGPRISSGASGFMSQVSSCDGPPTRNSRMQLMSRSLATAPEAAIACKRRQPQPQRRQRPGVEEIAARQAVAEVDRLPGVDSEHGATPLDQMDGRQAWRAGRAGLGQASILIAASGRVKHVADCAVDRKTPPPPSPSRRARPGRLGRLTLMTGRDERKWVRSRPLASGSQLDHRPAGHRWVRSLRFGGTGRFDAHR